MWVKIQYESIIFAVQILTWQLNFRFERNAIGKEVLYVYKLMWYMYYIQWKLYIAENNALFQVTVANLASVKLIIATLIEVKYINCEDPLNFLTWVKFAYKNFRKKTFNAIIQ